MYLPVRMKDILEAGDRERSGTDSSGVRPYAYRNSFHRGITDLWRIKKAKNQKKSVDTRGTV